MEIITKVIHSLLVLTALLGNLLVCLTIVKNRILRTPVNYLLLNLAISDLMIVTSFTLRHILEGLYHHPRGLQGIILCKIITSDTFTWVGAVSLAMTMLVLAYERYAAITFPLGTTSKLSHKKLKILIGLGWFLSVIFNIPLFYVRGLNQQRGHCESHWGNVTFAISYNIAWLFFIGIAPFCFMAFFYGKVILHLRREAVPRQHGSLAVTKSRQKVTKMLLIITAIYGVCYIPNLILYVVWYFALEAEVMYTINEVLLVLILVNSCVNPFVYAAQSRIFRRNMKKIVCSCEQWSRNRVNTSIHPSKSLKTLEITNLQLISFVPLDSPKKGLQFDNLGS
ncbi:neuromedin-U receptor 2-like [Stylophora pistillata]|uniref:neuromedin-U receptor 2-like n=1 Tax=Stylophora pistillata TaxID=50429 RepID=UPI000C05052B|nr:neuromedin-U receptor 2-like [Stylophora pistillata]